MALLQLKKVLLRSSTYNLGVLHSWRWVLGPPWPPESSHVISVLTVDLDFFHQEIYRCVLSLFPFAVSSGSPCQSLTYRSSVFRLMRPTGAPSFWRVHSRHVILCVHIYPGGRAADLSRRTTTALIYFQSHYYLWLFVSNNAFIQISSRVIMGQLKKFFGYSSVHVNRELAGFDHIYRCVRGQRDTNWLSEPLWGCHQRFLSAQRR